MDIKERELRQEIRRHLKSKMAEGTLEEGALVNWMLDKVSNFAKSHFNNVKDYQYARMMSTPEFRQLSKHFNMSEKDFMSKATALVKKSPDKFFDILAYDVRKGTYAKYFR